MSGVSDADREKHSRGKIKVKRYWPGKPPEWAAADGADITTSRQTALVSQIAQKDDPRLRRLAQIWLIDRQELRADHRRIRQAEEEEEEEKSLGVDGAESENVEDEDARRRRIRQDLVQRQEDEEDSEFEYESDSESEYESDLDTVKPAVLFVPKSERETMRERERMEAEERAFEEAVRRRMEQRKAETKQIVVEKIREQEMIHKNKEEASSSVETDEELDEAEEYEKWKAREIERMKTKRNREAEDEEESTNPNPKAAAAEGGKRKRRRFLQKYYHKGCFFQSDADEIYSRDFSSPTGEDKMDKTKLPKVMQVKGFGRRGRSKYTHLLNEDTTRHSALHLDFPLSTSSTAF